MKQFAGAAGILLKALNFLFGSLLLCSGSINKTEYLEKQQMLRKVWDQIVSSDRRIIQLVGIFAGLLIPFLRLIFPEDANDPLELRLAISGWILFVIGISFTTQFSRAFFLGLALLSYLIVITWFGYLTYVNDFSPDYVLGFVVTFNLIAPIIRHFPSLVVFTLFSLLGVFVIFLATHNPIIPAAQFWSLIPMGILFLMIYQSYQIFRNAFVERERNALKGISDTVLQYSDEGILVTDAENKVLRFNPALVTFIQQEGILLKPGAVIAEAGHALLLADPEADRLIELPSGYTLKRYSQTLKKGDVFLGRIWFFKDITEQQQRERSLEARRHQLAQFNTRLFELAQDPFLVQGDQKSFVLEICNSALALLDLDRACIWDWNEQDNCLDCILIAERGGKVSYGGPSIKAEKHSPYFKTILDIRGIVESDTRKNPITADFIEGLYTGPALSIIQAPYRSQGQLAGLLSLEVSRESREWDDAQIAFAYSLADLVALGYEWSLRKETEIQLLERNFELDQFVYRVSHDLKAPLSAIKGLIEIMHLEPLSPGIQDILGRMVKSTGQLEGFIHDLVAFSSNEQGDLVPEPVSLEAIIREVLDGVAAPPDVPAPERLVEVRQEGVFYADVYRLRIILGNLISNAMKFYDAAKPRHKIRIRAVTHPQQVLIEIEDNGTGISQAHQERIFDMFFRGSHRSFGSGLGMYITKKVTEKLGGTIELSSEPGIGTRFKVALPDLATFSTAEHQSVP